MATIVKGHGSREDDVETFVPVGTTLKFYSDYDVDLGTTVALVAIATGAKATPTETVTGTGAVGDVANYAVWTQDDGFIAKWLAMGGESGIPIKWVGTDIPNGTRLCAAPSTCKDGVHTCTGVLGTVKDTEIIVLACRGYVKDDNAGTARTLGTNVDDPLHDISDQVAEMVEKILTMAQADPAGAEALADSLPQGSIALMTNRVDYASWQKARHLKDYAKAGDLKQFQGQVSANEDDLKRIMKWLDDIPSYGAAVDSFVQDNAQRIQVWLKNDTASAAVFKALKSRGVIQDATIESEYVPSEADVNQIKVLNQSNLKNTGNDSSVDVKAGGILVLIGDGHEDDAEAYVRRQGDKEAGKITVGKAGAFNKGTLTVKGVSRKKGLVEMMLGDISEKKVTFA